MRVHTSFRGEKENMPVCGDRRMKRGPECLNSDRGGKRLKSSPIKHRNAAPLEAAQHAHQPADTCRQRLSVSNPTHHNGEADKKRSRKDEDQALSAAPPATKKGRNCTYKCPNSPDLQTAEGLERWDAVFTNQHTFQDAHSYRPRDAELQQHGKSTALKGSSVAAEAHVELVMSQDSIGDEDAQAASNAFHLGDKEWQRLFALMALGPKSSSPKENCSTSSSYDSRSIHKSSSHAAVSQASKTTAMAAAGTGCPVHVDLVLLPSSLGHGQLQCQIKPRNPWTHRLDLDCAQQA